MRENKRESEEAGSSPAVLVAGVNKKKSLKKKIKQMVARVKTIDRPNSPAATFIFVFLKSPDLVTSI